METDVKMLANMWWAQTLTWSVPHIVKVCLMSMLIPENKFKGLINGSILNALTSVLQSSSQRRRRKQCSLSNPDALPIMQQYQKCRPVFKCCVNQPTRILLQSNQFVSKLWQCSNEQLEAHQRRTRWLIVALGKCVMYAGKSWLTRNRTLLLHVR